MDTRFARRLIVEPGETTTKYLFSQRIPGVFWVDWREASVDIIQMAAAGIGTGELAPYHDKGKLYIEWRGRRTLVPLKFEPGEQDLTLVKLNSVLAPDFEIRRIEASQGGDTLAYFVLSGEAWAALEAENGDKVNAAFQRPELPAPPSPAEELFVAKMNLHKARVRMKTTRFLEEQRKRTAAAPDTMPVVRPFVGDIVLAYEMAQGKKSRFVTEGELRRLGTDAEDLHDYAVGNSVPLGKGAGCFQDESGVHFELRGDHSSAACMALVPDVREAHEEQVGGPVIAAFPHQDLMCYTNGANAKAVDDLRKKVEDMDLSGVDALSRELFDWGPAGWTVRSRG